MTDDIIPFGKYRGQEIEQGRQMTPTEQQILALLERRQHDPTETYRWLIEAVEVLLRHQLELRKGLREEVIEQLNKDICKEVTKEVMDVLRNNGIIR